MTATQRTYQKWLLCSASGRYTEVVAVIDRFSANKGPKTVATGRVVQVRKIRTLRNLLVR